MPFVCGSDNIFCLPTNPVPRLILCRLSYSYSATRTQRFPLLPQYYTKNTRRRYDDLFYSNTSISENTFDSSMLSQTQLTHEQNNSKPEEFKWFVVLNFLETYRCLVVVPHLEIIRVTTLFYLEQVRLHVESFITCIFSELVASQPSSFFHETA